MSAKTYLQLVNKTLVLLREPQVASVGASDYAVLVGEYINQAKEKVENSWKWRALQMTYTLPLTVDQQVYSLNSTFISGTPARYPDERAYLLRDKFNKALVFDTSIQTNSYRLQELETATAAYQAYPGAGSFFQNIPASFSYQAGETPSITLGQRPPAGRTLTLLMVVPQDEFTLGSETILVPWRPVLTLAYALANDERGEDLGQDGSLLFAKAADELAGAIARDIESGEFEMMAD